MNFDNISNIFGKLNSLELKNIDFQVLCKNLPASICSFYIEYNNKKMIVLNENLSFTEAYFYIIASSYFAIDYTGPQKITTSQTTLKEKKALEYANLYATKLYNKLK